MKVYLVWSGDYEQRGPMRVFSTQADAQAYADDSRHPSDYEIEEIEVAEVPDRWLTIYEAEWNTIYGEKVTEWWTAEARLGVEEVEQDKRRYFYKVAVRTRTQAEAVEQMTALRAAWMQRRGLSELPEPELVRPGVS